MHHDECEDINTNLVEQPQGARDLCTKNLVRNQIHILTIMKTLLYGHRLTVSPHAPMLSISGGTLIALGQLRSRLRSRVVLL